MQDKIIKIIQEQLGSPIEDLKDESTLEFLCADDLDIVELVMALEEEFGIIIPEEDFNCDSKSMTIKQIREIVQREIANKKEKSDG